VIGFIEDMPNSEYHAMDGISKSGLDKIARSPAHFMYGEKRKPTRNMDIETAIHAAILEPERYRKEYVVSVAEVRSEKKYKELAAVYGGDKTLTAVEGERVEGMIESVSSDLEAVKILTSSGKAELSGVCIDPETGIKIRARFDWLTDSGVSLDLKKTQDIRKFSRSVSDYRYHVQDAMYSFVYELITGEKLQAFKFLAVEELAPHSCRVFELDELSKEIGEFYFRRDLREYARCIDSGKWPGPDVGDGVISVSNWDISNYENDLEVVI
jgi:hypothetical protein